MEYGEFNFFGPENMFCKTVPFKSQCYKYSLLLFSVLVGTELNLIIIVFLKSFFSVIFFCLRIDL